MLMPKRVKHRKVMRGRMCGTAQRGAEVSFGEYGLKALESSKITSRQIEAARIAINRKVKRGGKLWIRIFPDKPYSKRAPGSRMGNGKGDVAGYVAVVKPGRIIFEVSGITKEQAHEALRLASVKLPVTTKIVGRL